MLRIVMWQIREKFFYIPSLNFPIDLSWNNLKLGVDAFKKQVEFHRNKQTVLTRTSVKLLKILVREVREQ